MNISYTQFSRDASLTDRECEIIFSRRDSGTMHVIFDYLLRHQ